MVSSEIRTPRSFRVFAAIALVALAFVSLPSAARGISKPVSSPMTPQARLLWP